MPSGTKALFSAAAFVVVCAGIKLAAPILVPLLLATFITIVTTPLVSWSVSKGLPRALAIAFALLVDIAVIAAGIALLSNSAQTLYLRLPHYQASLAQALDQLARWLMAHQVPLPPDWASRLADPAPVLGAVAALLRSVASLVSNLLLVLLIVGFMLIETTGLKAKLLTVLDRPEDFDRVARGLAQVDRYLVFKTVISLVTGLLLGAWNAILGVDLFVLWGVVAFAFNYIPTVGSLIAAGPPILLTLASQDPGRALLVAAGYFAVNFTIGNMLEPRIMGRVLGLSPLVILLSIVFWGWLLGPMGALLSVPLTMIFKIYVDNDPQLQRYATFLGSPALAATLAQERASQAPPTTEAEPASEPSPPPS